MEQNHRYPIMICSLRLNLCERILKITDNLYKTIYNEISASDAQSIGQQSVLTLMTMRNDTMFFSSISMSIAYVTALTLTNPLFLGREKDQDGLRLVKVRTTIIQQ